MTPKKDRTQAEASSGPEGPRADDPVDAAEEVPGSGPDREELDADEEAGDPLAELTAELESVRDRQLRLAAEFDNYRKRVERERAELRARAASDLVAALLDPMDDLHRIVSAGTDADDAPLLEGVRMVERKLMRALEEAGLEPVAADGERFDPEVHEALMTVPAESEEEDELVADVFQRGYRLGSALLRPARVRVKKFAGPGGGEG